MKRNVLKEAVNRSAAQQPYRIRLLSRSGSKQADHSIHTETTTKP